MGPSVPFHGPWVPGSSMKMKSFSSSSVRSVAHGAKLCGRIHLFGEKAAAEGLEVHGMPLRNLPIHFASIKHFHQDGFDAQDCIEVLRRSPRLLRAVFLSAQDLFPMLPVTNSSIQYLQVLEASDALWQSMTLPSLRELKLGDRCQCKQSVTEFVGRSQCPLQKASFGWPKDESDLLTFLKSVPSLEELEWIYADTNLEASILELLGETADVDQDSQEGSSCPTCRAFPSQRVETSRGHLWFR